MALIEGTHAWNQVECDVVRPRKDHWTDKFIISEGEGTVDMVECMRDGSSVNCGVWPLGSVHADEWAVLPDDDAEKALCSVIQYPNNEYEYCDIENVGLAACTGKKTHNKYFFSDLGFFVKIALVGSTYKTTWREYSRWT